MAKKGKKVPIQNKKNSKVPPGALERKNNIDYFNLTPVFKFSNTDPNKWTITDWSGEELKDLISTFKLMEKLPWNELLKHKGLRIKLIRGINNPPHISPEESIYEIRVCKVKRLFGFIDKNVFNIIWFDRTHSVCPEGKQRKYG